MSSTIHAPQRILVPVDLSPASAAGLKVAGALAARFDAHVTVVHVDFASEALADMLASSGTVTAPGDIVADHVAATGGRLRSFAAEVLGNRDFQAHVLESGTIATTVLDFARERAMDWICMSAAGRTGFRRFFLGSTAAEIVRQSPLPVLTLRADDDAFVFDDFRNVMVATDLGEARQRVVDAGALLAAPRGRVTLLHVIEVPAELGLYGVPLTVPGENLDAAREWAGTALETLGRSVTGAEVAAPRVVVGRPAAAILAAEAESRPDVTVIGTHGRTGLDRIALGSVAEQVVRRAAGPVLVLPTHD